MSHRALAGGLVAALVASSMALFAPASLVAPAGAAVSVTPVWERTFGELNYHSSPTIADVDGDGTNDVVVGSQSGWVRVFKANGDDLSGWPQRASLGGTHTGLDGSPTVADLDRDGKNEVIVGVGSLRDPGGDGGIIVYNRDGTLRWAFQTQDRLEGSNGHSDAVFSTPAAGDVNGDGDLEVVFGSYDHFIYVLDTNGANVPGSPFYNEDTVWSSPALYDFDFDGRDEIFIGGDSSAGGTIDHAGGIMHMLEYRGGSLIERWRRYVGEIIVSSPAVGNIDGDAKPEVVFGTGDFFKNADSHRVFALNAESGSDVGGWPQSTNGDGWSSPALGDVNGDGGVDVAIGARDGRVYVWKGDGTKLWDVDPSVGTPYTAGVITGGPTIVDVNGDGNTEVLSASGNAVFARSGAAGALVDAFAINWQFQTSTAVGKFGSQWYVIAAGYLDATGQMQVAAYKIPEPKSAPWPMFHQNAAHTGALTSTATANGGYWILDDLGDVYAFGKAKHHGSVPTLIAGGTPIGGAPAMSVIGTSTGNGYWVLDQKGGMFSFGDAGFHGSVPGLKNAGVAVGDSPVVGLAGTKANDGYWLVDEVGAVYAFGNAKDHGSVAALRASGANIGNARMIFLSATPNGDGYWAIDEKGGMFAFGDAKYHGSVPGLRAAGVNVGDAPVVGMAPTATGGGYWMVDKAGGMFAFGDAKYFGSIPQLRADGVGIGEANIVGMVPTSTGNGYWLLDSKGGLFAFGDALYFGSLPDVGVSANAIAMTPAGR